jgi:hypothetical protein
MVIKKITVLNTIIGPSCLDKLKDVHIMDVNQVLKYSNEDVPFSFAYSRFLISD